MLRSYHGNEFFKKVMIFMNIKIYLPVLKRTGLFDGFPSEELLTLFTMHTYNLSQYKKGSMIYFENEICSSWDIILKGEVIIQKIDEKGRIN